MTADFFIKRRYLLSIVICLSLFVCFLGYTAKLAYATEVWVGKTFYFLISSKSDSEAAVHTMRLDGGAGYLLTDGDHTYIAYSVYLNDDALQAIQAGLTEETKIVKKSVRYVSFKGKDKKKAGIYCGALNNLYNGIDVLSQCIAKLESGGTQQACKRLLGILERQFGYMATVYQGQYPTFSNVCAGLQKKLQTLTEDTVFCKDLRYMLCETCEAYLRLAEHFSI